MQCMVLPFSLATHSLNNYAVSEVEYVPQVIRPFGCIRIHTPPPQEGASTDQFDLEVVLAGVRVDSEQGAVRFGGAESDGHQVVPAIRPPVPLVLVFNLPAARAELVANRLCNAPGGGAH